MKHGIVSLCSAVLLAPAAVWGQLPADDVTASEFPGLQFLPPGSKVKGISLPRYEKHRVSALLMAELMEIVSRADVGFTAIRANLYAENGETTVVTSPKADYSFRTKHVVSPGETTVDSTRFSARGTGVIFSTENNMGILKGPVKTTVKNSAFNRATKAK